VWYCLFLERPFVLFLLAIVLSVLLRFTDSDYPFGIFKHFLSRYLTGQPLFSGKCLQQVEHIRGNLWHIYSITINQVMVPTVTLSKWWLQLNQRTKIYDKRYDFNFSIVNFLFICSNIPAAPVYGVYISWLIRYPRACGSHQDFLDRGLLLTRKLSTQWFLLVKVFEDTKGVIRIRKSKKNRQHNGQKKKDKRTNNDLQNIHIKTKDRVRRTPLKTGGYLRLVYCTFVLSSFFIFYINHALLWN
jgi:hypothetical protein